MRKNWKANTLIALIMASFACRIPLIVSASKEDKKLTKTSLVKKEIDSNFFGTTYPLSTLYGFDDNQDKKIDRIEERGICGGPFAAPALPIHRTYRKGTKEFDQAFRALY